MKGRFTPALGRRQKPAPPPSVNPVEASTHSGRRSDTISPLRIAISRLLAKPVRPKRGKVWIVSWKGRRDARERLLERDRKLVIRRIETWAGGHDAAVEWYRAEPLPPYAGRTAEALVAEGRVDDVLAYLDSVAQGAFA